MTHARSSNVFLFGRRCFRTGANLRLLQCRVSRWSAYTTPRFNYLSCVIDVYCYVFFMPNRKRLKESSWVYDVKVISDPCSEIRNYCCYCDDNFYFTVNTIFLKDYWTDVYKAFYGFVFSVQMFVTI